MAFNRDRNRRPRSSFGGGRGGFGGRGGGDRGPVEMHQAICDNCGKSCEVPFRPTSGKPVYCSNCFENQRGGSDSRPMFNATCADCGDACKVPFQPIGDKPVFCSNCFGGKKNSEGNGSRDERSSSDLQDKFEELNVKLDNILKILENQKPAKKTKAKEIKETPLVTVE